MQNEGTRQRIVWKQPTLQIRYLLVMWCISFDLIFIQFSWFAFSPHSSVQVAKNDGASRPMAKSLNLKKNANQTTFWIEYVSWWSCDGFWRIAYSVSVSFDFSCERCLYVRRRRNRFCLLWLVEIYGNASKNYRPHEADDRRRHERKEMSTVRNENVCRFGANTIHINSQLDLRTIKCNHIIAHSMRCSVETRCMCACCHFNCSISATASFNLSEFSGNCRGKWIQTLRQTFISCQSKSNGNVRDIDVCERNIWNRKFWMEL